MKIKVKKIKNFIYKNKTYIICIVLLLLSIISVVIQSIDRKETLNVNKKEMINNDKKIAVYITGEVKSPGVYYVEEGARLDNLLDICGGVTNQADIEKLNLAQKLSDGEKITILKKEEDLSLEETESEILEEKKVNINEASKEELMSLDGIGEATANKIIEYRKENEFLIIEDIMNVSGIGEAKFDNIKDDICV
mgnify:CR=1 FL=1